MGNGIKILIVDDDPRVCEILSLYMQKEGFQVITSQNGEKALEIVDQESIDLIILDIMLPQMDGWEVCRVLRNKNSQIPVLMLTAKTEDYEKIIGLDLGADDYVEKPFNPVEIVSRVKAILRRVAPSQEKGKPISFPGLEINTEQYQVILEGKPVEMTPREVEILSYLARRPGLVFSREQLIKDIWGYEYTGDNRNIDVHIKHIRDKLRAKGNQPWRLETVWGVGYRFVFEPGRERENC